MKKAITTILSVLMLLSCLTVNVFANETNIENQDPETNGELNVQEEVSDDENGISLDGGLVSPLNEEGDSIQDIITVNDGKSLNVYHLEQNGADEWTFIISITDYYSDQPITATVKCESDVRFGQFMEDGSPIDSFTRLENGDVIVTLPKNSRTKIVLGDGNNAKEHLVSVECDFEQIRERSYFDGIELDDSFGFKFVMSDSQYNSEAKFFDTLAMALNVDKDTHQAIVNAIKSGSNTNLVEGFYTIHFKYDTLISKVFGVDVIDGFDIPYVIYQVSYDGVTENIIIYFNCNDNGNNDNIEPAISNVILVMGSTEIPLKCNYRYEKNIFEWTVDFSAFDENLGEDYYWSYINSSSPVKIKYKTGNNDNYVTIDDNSFVIGVIDELDIYTKYATYTDDETGQKHIFYLEPKTQVIDLDDVDEIKVSLNGNEKAISLDSYDEVEGRRFYKPSEGFNFVDSAVFTLTINIRNKEPLTFTYEDLRKYTINYSGTEVNIQGAKFYSKNDNCFIYFCSNYEIIDSTSGSFIKPFDNGGYWVNKRGDNEYVWTFNVDIEQFYNGNTVLLMKNNTAGSIDFAQTQQSINQSGLAEIKNVNGGFSIKPVFGSDLVFTATSNGVNQTHIICIQFDKNSILNKTGIKSVDITDGFYNFMANESIYNLNKGMFDSVAISANMPVYKLNQFISDVTGGDGVDLSQYLQFSFKGYQMKGNPSYIVSNGSFGKMVKVNFEISNGSAVETVVVYCQRIVDNKDQTLISIDGKEFYQEAFGDTLIYLPATNGSILEFDFNEIVNAVNSSTVQHKVIIVDYSIDFLNNGFNSSQRNIQYVDGYEMEENVRISLDLYYLDNPEVLKKGNLSKQDDLTRVGDSFNGPVNTSFLLDTFDNYTGALEHRLKTEKEMPYKTGSNSVPKPPAMSAGNPPGGESVSVWISYDNNTNKEEIYFYRNMRFKGPESVTYFNIANSDDGIRDYDRVIYVGEEGNTKYPATAEGLEKAVKDLSNSGRSSVILMSDLILNRNVYLKHNNSYSDNPDSNPKADLEINLNGHSINVQGNSIINLRHSAIHFTNYKLENGKSGTTLNNTTAVISGNGNGPVIENYGNLYIFDKVDISNPSGTAILTYNSGGLYLDQQTNINAGICIDIQENEIMADGREGSSVFISGNLSAKEIAIRTTTINSEIKNVIRLSNKNEDSSTADYVYQTITSKNIGILSSGDVQIETYGYQITASRPFIISGGSLEIRKTTVLSANIGSDNIITINSNPVIKIDSNNENATNTTLLIATENNVNMKTNGTLIQEVASKDSKIDKIYFYSINNRDYSFFDYQTLFSFDKPVTNAYIHVNGGCFINNDFEDYLLGTPKSIQNYNKDGKTYYYNDKKCFREVRNFDELEKALMNQDVQDIKLFNDISAPNSDSKIEFIVNAPKALFLNGYKISNVHFLANTTRPNAPKAFFSIQNFNNDKENLEKNYGTIENTGTVIESNTNSLYINNVNIVSTGDTAIKIYGGMCYFSGDNGAINIAGTKGVELSKKETGSLVSGNVTIKNTNITGNSGPAIDVLDTDKTIVIHISNNSSIKTPASNQGEENNQNIAGISSAARVLDRAVISLGNSEIFGKEYGVYFGDNLSAEGFVNYFAGVSFGSGAKLEGDIALRLGNNTKVFMNNANVVAKYKVMEIHDFTQYSIGSGIYEATDENGVIVDFVNGPSSSESHWHMITGGYYSHYVPDNAIFNNSNLDYVYKCLPVDTTGNKNPLPWVVAIKKKDVKNYQYLEVPSQKDVVIDENRLESAFDDDSFDVVLTVKFKNDSATKEKFDGLGKGFKEYYDIHVDKSKDNVVVQGVDETDNYQLISIPLNDFRYENQEIKYGSIENLKVYHKHKDMQPYALKKIEKTNAKNAKEECYYLENDNGQWYLNIITKRFSDFAIQQTDSEIPTETPKANYELTLGYAAKYNGVPDNLPQSAGYGENKTISINDVDVVYYSINNTPYYRSSSFPTETGEYAVEWTVKEDLLINNEYFTGKGRSEFSLLMEDLDGITLANNLVYTGKDLALIETDNDVDNYIFEITSSNSKPKTVIGEIPTVINAGNYRVRYSKNGIFKDFGEVVVKKAQPILPNNLTGVYGNKIYTISLENYPGWQWENPLKLISDVGEMKFDAYFSETENYCGLSTKLTVNVNKKPAPNPQLPNSKTVEYGTALGDIKLTGTWKWVDETIVPTVANNGYSAYIIVDDIHFDWSGHPEYNPDKHTYTVTIPLNVEKANPIDTNPDTLSAVYGDKITDFVLTGGWYWDNKTIVFSEIGKVTVTAKIDATDNYEESTKQITVNVGKKKAEIPVKPTAKSVEYGVTLADVTLSDSNWNWVDDSIKPTVTNNGYKAYIEVDDTHYDWEGIAGYDSANHRYVANISVTVSKAMPVYDTPEGLTATYGDSLSTVSLPNNNWSWVDGTQSVGNATATGNKFVAKYNPDADNYNDALVELTVIVNKATPIYNPTGLTATYNDTLSVITLDQGWQWLEPDRVLTEIGEVNAKAKVDATDNYLAAEKDLTITVNKKQASVSSIPTTNPVVYGVTLADVTLSDSDWKWVDNTIKPTVTNNGYQAYIAVDDIHYNWEGIDGYDSVKHRYVANISVTVSKADPIDVNPGTLTAVYGDKLSQFKLTGGWYWEDADIMFNNIGNMTVNAKIDETDNYKGSTKQITVNVGKKKAEIPVKPTAKSVEYGVTLANVELSDKNWNWVDDSIKPTVTNNGYKAYIEVDDTHYDWEGIAGYDSANHRYEATLSVKVSKAVQDKTKITIPVIKNVEKGTLLEKIELPANWKWEKSSNVVGDSNYAIYNPDDANYVDLLVSIPVSIKETVGDKTVSISNIVSSSDEKGIEEVAVKNDGISKSVVDAVANTADTNTKINNKDVTDLIKAADSTTSLNISTEFIKNTVTKEEDISNAISKADVKADEVAMVLDLEIKIKVNNGTTEKEGNITELAEPVELTFKLPEGSKTTAAEGKELKYYVLVIHGDDVLKIPATLNAADGTVTFSADKFSTYILVSEEVTKTVAENSTPSYVPSANKKPVVNTAAK